METKVRIVLKLDVTMRGDLNWKCMNVFLAQLGFSLTIFIPVEWVSIAKVSNIFVPWFKIVGLEVFDYIVGIADYYSLVSVRFSFQSYQSSRLICCYTSN